MTTEFIKYKNKKEKNKKKKLTMFLPGNADLQTSINSVKLRLDDRLIFFQKDF